MPPGSLIDAALTLPSGTVVHVRNLVRFQGDHSTHLTIVVETPSPATDEARVKRDAVEIVEWHREYAKRSSLDGITVQVCRTQACIELRERSGELFHFVLRPDGAWVLEPNAESPGAAL